MQGVQAIATVLPRSRPTEFAAVAPRSNPLAPTGSTSETPVPSARAGFAWQSLPALPSPQEIGLAVAQSTDDAGKALRQATAWATQTVSGVLHLE